MPSILAICEAHGDIDLSEWSTGSEPLIQWKKILLILSGVLAGLKAYLYMYEAALIRDRSYWCIAHR